VWKFVRKLTISRKKDVTFFSNQNLRFSSTCKIVRIHYTSIDYSKSTVTDDSAVLFKLEDRFHFGLINSIRHVTVQVQHFAWTELKNWVFSSSSNELEMVISSFHLNWKCWPVHLIWTVDVDQFISSEREMGLVKDEHEERWARECLPP
jgi:hypothetical protein